MVRWYRTRCKPDLLLRVRPGPAKSLRGFFTDVPSEAEFHLHGDVEPENYNYERINNEEELMLLNLAYPVD